MKKFFTGTFAVISVVAAFIYFISCFTPYISPVTFWPMAFLALGYPYLAAGLLLLIILWLFVKRKIALVLFLLLLVGYQNIYSTIAFDLSASQKPEKKVNTLRILSWNVRSFDNPSRSADTAMGVRRRMFNYLKQVNPDILCLQEFTEFKGESFLSNTNELVDLGYQFYYKTNEIPRYFNWGYVISGTAIFSKVPIVDSGKVILGDPTYPEHLAFIDVLLENKPLRIFSAHFKSINLFAQIADPDNKVVFHGDSDLVYRDTKLEKLKIFSIEHAKQASIVKDQLNRSPHPLLYFADMNSVPTSYAYYRVSHNLQDAFLTKGTGLGTTLDSLPSTLRIDFLFADKKLLIENYQKDELHLSDHFPQFIDVARKE